MPRLKTLLACAGLSSFTRRAAMPKGDFRPEPIRRPFDEGKSEMADDWMFEADSEFVAHKSALDELSSSLGRLRETLSALSAHAPIMVEAEPVMSLGAMSFDGDLFDGEPMFAEAAARQPSDLDAILFGDTGPALEFGTNDDVLFQQAA